MFGPPGPIQIGFLVDCGRFVVDVGRFLVDVGFILGCFGDDFWPAMEGRSRPLQAMVVRQSTVAGSLHTHASQQPTKPSANHGQVDCALPAMASEGLPWVSNQPNHQQTMQKSIVRGQPWPAKARNGR